MLHSSGNAALDQAAVDAIRRARFETPPPGLSADDRTYIIDYIFG
jgi:TonB family protein